ncbi:MAG: hypothetical protein HC780_07445 [Leptolyngbyaceae cyanobacterium CSU_1_3]|nr:hypothetical protein [Leptolyngbyaceae cyanobacterium CSU_1_3]
MIAQRLAIVALAFLLVLPLQGCFPAQAQPGLESRISRLETDLFGLQNRLNQLEGRTRSGGLLVPVPSGSPRERPPSRVSSADPQFDRLATLVIELKERVTKLEERLAKSDRP